MPDNFNNKPLPGTEEFEVEESVNVEADDPLANRPLPGTETEVVDVVDEYEDHGGDCPPGKKWDPIQKGCVPKVVKKIKEEINKTAPKDSKSLVKRDNILKKIQNGFKVTIDEAQFLTKYGYSFTDGFDDRFTIQTGSNINDPVKKEDYWVKVTDIGDLWLNEGEHGIHGYKWRNYNTGEIIIGEEEVIQNALGGDQQRYIKPHGWEIDFINLDKDKGELIESVNKNKFNEDFYNEYGKIPDVFDERKFRRIHIYDLDGKKISSNDQQDFQMLYEAVTMVDPFSDAKEFERRWNVSLAEVLQIPEEDFEVEGYFNEYGSWVEKPRGERNRVPGTKFQRSPVSDNVDGRVKGITNEFYSKYQNDPKFDNIRSFQGAEIGSNLRELDLISRGGNIIDEGDIRDRYLEMSKQYGSEEGVIAPQLLGQYYKELNEVRFGDKKEEVASYKKAVKEQTKDLLNVVKDYLPVKIDPKTNDHIQFDFDYASEMRVKMANAQSDQELKELSDEWIKYVRSFDDAVGEESELLIDYKTGNFLTREEVEKQGMNESSPDLMSMEEWIKTEFEGDDASSIEQKIVDQTFEVLGTAISISDKKTKKLLESVGGPGSTFALFDLIRNATTGVYNYDKVQELANSGKLKEIAKELPTKYESVPGVFAYNQAVRKLKGLSRAYYMNIDPLTFEQDGFVDGFGDAAGEWISGMNNASPDDQKQMWANFMAEDFPEVWDQFSEADKAEFFETSNWRKLGTSTFEFGLMAVDFAVTKGLLGGAARTIVWGSKLGYIPGVTRSGGLYNWTLRGLGPGTGKAGKGFATFSALTAEEAIYIQGVNMGVSQFTRPGQEDMSLWFAPGSATMKMLMNMKFLSSPKNEALGQQISKTDKFNDKLINSENKFAQGFGFTLEGARSVGNWAKGVAGGTASLKGAMFLDHGVFSPVYNYFSGDLSLDDAQSEFLHALHSLTDIEDWGITAGSLIAAGGIPLKSTYVKGRELLENYSNIITNKSNIKYVDKYANNLNTNYKTIFEDGQNTSEGTNYAVQRNRIEKAKEEQLKKKGVVDKDGNIDQIKYESNGASILNLAKTALKADGKEVPENFTHEQAFELLENSGVFENTKKFQDFIDAIGIEVLSSFNANEFAANKRSVENVREMIESGDMQNHKDHFITEQSAQVLNNVVEVNQMKNVLRSTEQQHKNLLAFQKIAKSPNKNPNNFLSVDGIEFISSAGEGTIVELLRENGWSEAQIAPMRDIMKTIRGFDAKANHNGLIQGSKERKKYLENEIELAKLYESKQQFEEQTSDIAEFKNLEQWDKRAEILGISANSNPSIEALRSTINKINKLEKANDEILKESNKAMAERGEVFLNLAKKHNEQFEVGKILIKETTAEFDAEVEKLYQEENIDRTEYLKLKEKKAISSENINKLQKIDTQLKELKKDPELNADKIKKLEKEEADILTQSGDLLIKGANIRLKDGTEINLLDKSVIAELKDFTTGQHEIIHTVANQIFRELNILENKEKKDQFISEFKNALPDAMKEKVLRRLKNDPEYKAGDVNTVEWLNYFAESLIKGEFDNLLDGLKSIEPVLENFIKKENIFSEDFDLTVDGMINFLFGYARDTRQGLSSNKISAALAGADITLNKTNVAKLSAEVEKLTDKKKKLTADNEKAMEGLSQSDPNFKEKFKEKNGVSHSEYLSNYAKQIKILNTAIENAGIKTSNEGKTISVNAKNLGLHKRNQENIEIVQNPNSSTAEINAAKTRILEDNFKMLADEKNKWYTWGKPYGISKGEWDAEVDARALMAINRYDKSKEAILSTHMFNAFKFLAKDIQKTYEVDKYVSGFEDRAFENIAQNVGRISGGEASVGDAFYEVQTSTGDQVIPKDVLLREEFGIPESNTVEINDIIKDKIPTLKMNLKEGQPLLDYKTIVKGVGPEVESIIIESGIFGDIRKNPFGKKEQNKLVERRKIISDNIGLLYSLLPKNINDFGDATGVANSVLGWIYQKGDRAKFETTGKGKGVAVQEKLDLDLTNEQVRNDFINALTIGDGTTKGARNANTLYNALVRTVSEVTANQYVREFFETPEGKQVAEQIAPDYANKLTEVQYMENLLFGIKSGMSEDLYQSPSNKKAIKDAQERLLNKDISIEEFNKIKEQNKPQALFSAVDKEAIDRAKDIMDEFKLSPQQFGQHMASIHLRGYANMDDNDAALAIREWTLNTVDRSLREASGERFIQKIKNEERNVEEIAKDLKISTKDAEQILTETVNSKNLSRIRTVDGEKVFDQDVVVEHDNFMQSYVGDIIKQFPDLAKNITDNMGSQAINHLFGFGYSTTGEGASGQKAGGAKHYAWFDPQANTGKAIENVDWISQETIDLYNSIDFSKVRSENITAPGAMAQIKKGIQGPITSKEQKLQLLKEQTDAESKENLDKLNKFFMSLLVDKVENSKGDPKALKEALIAAKRLRQADTNLVFGNRGLYAFKWWDVQEGSQALGPENPLWNEYYEQALVDGKSVADAEKFANQKARIKGEHLFAISNENARFINALLTGKGREYVTNLELSERIQIGIAAGKLDIIDKAYSEVSEGSYSRLIPILEELRNVTDPLTGEMLVDEVIRDATKKIMYDPKYKEIVSGSQLSAEVKPTKKKMVVYMVGGPGSGKSTIVNSLNLEGQGFTVVNLDTKKEELKKLQNLPADEKFEKGSIEASVNASIMQTSIQWAEGQREKLMQEGENIILDGTGASYNATMKKVTEAENLGYEVQVIYAKTSKDEALRRNENRAERSLDPRIVKRTYDDVIANIEKYKEAFGDRFNEVDTEGLAEGELPQEFVTEFNNKLYESDINRAESALTSDPLIRDQFTEFSIAPTRENAIKLQEAINNKEQARTEQQDQINNLKDNINLSAMDKNSRENLDKELKGYSPSEIVQLNENVVQIRNKNASVEEALKEEAEGNVYDGDEVLWMFPKGKEPKIRYRLPNGKTGSLTNTQFNRRQKKLEEKGAVWDYSEFTNLDNAVPGPAFEKALEKFKQNPDYFFISTARAPESKQAIVNWMNANGFEGFNESHLYTVEGTLDAGGESKKVTNTLMKLYSGDNAAGVAFKIVNFNDDNKDPNIDHWVHASKEMGVSGLVETVVHKSDTKLSAEEVDKYRDEGKLYYYEKAGPGEAMNLIIQDTEGIDASKRYNTAKARIRGRGKKAGGILPLNAQDFGGLLYGTLAKGKVGEQQWEYYNKTIIEPYSNSEKAIEKQSIRMGEEYNDLKNKYPDVVSSLDSRPDALNGYTVEQAIRVNTWLLEGKKVKDISETDLNNIKKFVNANEDVLNFSKSLLGLSGIGTYNGGDKGWLDGNILTDITRTINKDIREVESEAFRTNADLMFSEENLSKLEAAYGTKFRTNMEQMLYAMKTGKNRAYDLSPTDNKLYGFLNNANGALMAVNFRSATLQLTSTLNYLNWGDNNIAKASAAFANQPQFWKDFVYLWNSKEGRRKGSKLNIAEAEIVEAMKGKQNKGQAVVSYLINKGYAPTRTADSFAIAFGGASFYRNRVNSLVKKGMSLEEAEAQAYLDFDKETESHQQSRRPDKISNVQRSLKGRFMLGFHTTQMQYARMIDKSMRDIKNGRGNLVENISKIMNYGAIQPLLFSALQTGSFMMLFQDDTDEANREKTKQVVEGAAGSLVEGTGTWGVVANTMYHVVDTYIEEREKEGVFGNQLWKAGLEVLRLSPSIGGKVKMGLSGMYSQMYKDQDDTWSIDDIIDPDSPNLASATKWIQTATNLPAEEVRQLISAWKSIGVQTIGEGASDIDAVKIAALALGWPEWQLESSIDKEARTSQEKLDKKYKQAVKDPSVYSKPEQESVLKQLGYSDSEIISMKNERERSEAILKAQKEKEKIFTPSDEYKVDRKNKDQFSLPGGSSSFNTSSLPGSSDPLYDMNKAEQLDSILKLKPTGGPFNFPLTEKQIKEKYPYEEDRVKLINELNENK